MNEFYLLPNGNIVSIWEDATLDYKFHAEEEGIHFFDFSNRSSILINNELKRQNYVDRIDKLEDLQQYFGWEDEYSNPSFQQLADLAAKNGFYIYPLFKYEHSGVAYSTSNDHYPFNDRFDSWKCGIVMINKEHFKELLFDQNNNLQWRKGYEIVDSYIEKINLLEQGQVWGYTLYDKYGEELDSCGGFVQDLSVFLTTLPLEILGMTYSEATKLKTLGEYRSIEDCIEDNQEKLNIEVKKQLSLRDRIVEKESIMDDKVGTKEHINDNLGAYSIVYTVNNDSVPTRTWCHAYELPQFLESIAKINECSLKDIQIIDFCDKNQYEIEQGLREEKNNEER